MGSPVRRVEAAAGLPVSHIIQAERLPNALEISSGEIARLVIDMGRIVSGLVQFELEAAAGTVFDLAYVEEPIKNSTDPIGQHAGTRYIARGENDSFQVFDSNGFRYAYILVHNLTGPVNFQRFAVQEQLYPWEDGATFECNDEELNRLYRAGVRTVQLNSHDAFIDCPTREQRAWVGDGVVHQMVHLATNQDWRLAWRYLTLCDLPRSDGMLPMSVVGDIEAGGGFTIPDWALNWIHGVHNLYRFKGDQETVKAFMPTIERVLRWYAPFQTAGGVLKDVIEWNLVDWSSVLVDYTSSILTAHWARSLREFAEMADWLEERSSQRWAESLYRKAQAGFEVFWDEARFLYRSYRG